MCVSARVRSGTSLPRRSPRSTPEGVTMRRTGRRASAIGALVLLLSVVGVGVVVAGSRSSDERALRKTRSAPSHSIETKVNALLGKMTLEEKLNQLTLVA